MRSNKKIFVALAAAGLVAAGGSAFTASSTVADHKLGQDVGAITGYVTSSVAYTYDSDGTVITNVSFVLDGAATTVKSRVTSSAATPGYVNCLADTDTDAGGPDEAVSNGWNCDVTDVTVANSTGLDVFASSI